MVAERADAATRTVYNHFSTRQEFLGAVQAQLLQPFREALQMNIPETGDPAERLRMFVAVLFDMYQRQGAALTTLLEFDQPSVRNQIRDMGAWRRDRLGQILRPAKETLRLPLTQAVAFAFVMTNHVSWRVLRDELSLTQAKAIDTTVSGLQAGVFGVTVDTDLPHAH
jgi:AcrR family transcriptional regulator